MSIYRDGANSEMSVNGATVTFNNPQRLPQRFNDRGEEIAHGLPPYAQVSAYNVDEYLACPESWPRGESGKSASYMVPVKVDHGMWLDFNGNSSHTHDIAIVISMQGINSVSGLPAELALHQYKNCCPVHKDSFNADRFCHKCNIKWPPQNYLSSTGTPEGLFWIDGFRAANLITRQYFFTKEEERGIAAQMLGKARTFNIGIAFWRSKSPKPFIHRPVMRGCSPDSLTKGSGGILGHYGDGMRSMSFSASRGPTTRSIEVDRLEIAAGAKIEQMIYPDPKDIGYWENDPFGQIFINYAQMDEVIRIINSGKADVEGNPNGFMGNLVFGTPEAGNKGF